MATLAEHSGQHAPRVGALMFRPSIQCQAASQPTMQPPPPLNLQPSQQQLSQQPQPMQQDADTVEAARLTRALHRRLNLADASQQMPAAMSQDDPCAQPAQPLLQQQQQQGPASSSQQLSQQYMLPLLSRDLRIEVTHQCSADMGTPEFATPVEQQFRVDYDISSTGIGDQQDRSPAHSPKRHIKRPRHLTSSVEDMSQASSQPSQPTHSGETSSKCTSGMGCSSFKRPPVINPARSRLGAARPQSPAKFVNLFMTGFDPDQQHGFDSRHPRALPTTQRIHVEFDVGREVGRGTFSAVYRAKHRLDGCEYAIKRTKEPAATDKDKNQWLQEVQALAAVQAHPHIVQYYSAWAEPDLLGEHLYIQLEMCASSLGHEIHSNRTPWPEAEVAVLLKQMASALAHIHGLGIVHMDVKPDNIFRCFPRRQSQDAACYKLGDFGMATLRNGQFRVVDGDARYLSQEMIESDYSALDKADIYALGITAYELLQGRELPRTGAPYSRLRKGTVALLPNVTVKMMQLVESMMAEDPLKRPSAADVLLNPVLSKGALNMRRTSV